MKKDNKNMLRARLDSAREQMGYADLGPRMAEPTDGPAPDRSVLVNLVDPEPVVVDVSDGLSTQE